MPFYHEHEPECRTRILTDEVTYLRAQLEEVRKMQNEKL
jgi:hypothetical protein